MICLMALHVSWHFISRGNSHLVVRTTRPCYSTSCENQDFNGKFLNFTHKYRRVSTCRLSRMSEVTLELYCTSTLSVRGGSYYFYHLMESHKYDLFRFAPPCSPVLCAAPSSFSTTSWFSSTKRCTSSIRICLWAEDISFANFQMLVMWQ